MCIQKIFNWFECYVLSRGRSVPLVWVLIIVHAWVEYALVAILIVHLTDDWLSLPRAASIVNVQDGVTAFLALLVAYASDHLGSFQTVLYTTISYIIGLVVLFFASWRLQSIETSLIYVALILIACGRSGRDIPLKEFLADQLEYLIDGKRASEELTESRRKVWWRSAYMLGIGASVYVFANASWIQLSKISAIAMAVALGFFLGGTAYYERKPITSERTLHNMLRVIYAAISKRHMNHVITTNNDALRILPDIPKLRWLDKAAIEEASISPEERCTFEQVREVKILLTMIPLWTTFLTYGLLQATGNTFFFEQVNYTDTHLGRISQVPVVIFVIVKSSTSFIVSRLCDKLSEIYQKRRLDQKLSEESESTEKICQIPRYIMLIRIGIGLGFGPICCVFAWRVENYRLEQYVNRDVSISFLWLIPQFFLLGFMEGMVYDGMEEFFGVHAPKSFNKYGPSFTQFALHIGNFISLAFILIFHGLFADTLDSSSLGTYYAMLGYVCFVNLLFYCCVATYYVKEEPHALDQTEQELQEQPQSLEDTTCCTDHHEQQVEIESI